MSRTFRNIDHDERCQISTLLKVGFSTSAIARELNRSRSTVHREIDRNSGEQGYDHNEADEKAKARRRAASCVPWRFTSEMRTDVEARLKEGWSPDQISGRLRMKGRQIGRQRIYNHVHADKKAGGDLFQCLRRRGKKPNFKGKSHAGRGHIPNRVDISDRPDIVDDKVRLGDWEVDTIIGKNHRGAIVSTVDRVSKYTFLLRVLRKTKEAVCSALIRQLSSDGVPVLTITADNGKEFADHVRVAEKLGADFYFAKPYHSWERGLNEHTNGLVRGYLPKETDFLEVSDEEVQKVQDLLNSRPRKVLGYRTPAEVMFDRDLQSA